MEQEDGLQGQSAPQPGLKKIVYGTLSHEDVQTACEAFGVGELVKFSQLGGGLANVNYLLTTSLGLFVIKLCFAKNQPELEVQVKATSLAHEFGVPVCKLFALKRPGPEEHVLVLDGKLIMLLEFIAGTVGTIDGITTAQLTNVGSSLAFLHKIPEDRLVTLGLPGPPMGLSSIKEFLVSIETTIWDSHPFVVKMKRTLNELFPAIEDPELPKGMMHADVFPDNVIFGSDDKVKGLLDFEEVCFGSVIFDIVSTVCGCCFPHDNQFDFDLMRAFILGYNSVRPLNPSEIRLFVPFFQYACLCIAFWRFRQFNVLFPDPDLKESYKIIDDRMDVLSALPSDFLTSLLDQH